MIWLAVLTTAFHPNDARGQVARSLANRFVRAEFDARGLRALTDSASRHRFGLEADGFRVVIDNETLASVSLDTPRREVEPGRITYRYASGPVHVTVRWELRPDWHFISKQIELRVDGARQFRVRDIEILRETFEDTPTDAYEPPSARANLQTGVYGSAVRFDSTHSLLLVAQNPFLRVTRTERALAMRYAPDMDWKVTYGAFVSDRALIAPVRLTGRRLAAAMAPEWQPISAANATPGLDEAEVAAFTDMVRSFLLYRPAKPITVFVGWCANDYQIDVGTSEGRAEYKRVIDQAAALGSEYVLYAPSNSAISRREESVDDWSWEHVLWLGLGQKIRKNEWNPRTSPIPASVSEMLDYARGKRVGLLAYVYPVLPFAQNPEWLVPARNPQRKAASLANRALQDWLIDELVAFHRRTGIAGYAFDHTFLTFDGGSRYAQWWGWRRVMEELRRRVPDIVIDGRQAYHLYGPWSWLAGSYPHPTLNDEQPESFTPYPDLHFDRVSADRERYTAFRYRNYEFAPSELVPGFITHQTSRSDDTDDMPSMKTADRGVVLTPYRVRDWDYLGWRYSLLSSIAVAGWNNVLNMIPARDSAERVNFAPADRAWLRQWLAWTVQNREYLRRTRPILGQPALGKIDGTSAIIRNRGYVFLFNPDSRRLTATLPLDATIGLEARGTFVLREVYPLEGRRLGKPNDGFWRAGDRVEVALDGGSATVLEIAPVSSPVTEPLVFNAPGRASVVGGVLDVRDVRGEVGTTATLLVALPRAAAVTRARVNGVDVPVGARHANVVELTVRFEGQPFGRLQPALVPDSSFAGGRLSGTFVIPKRVFDQLAERRRAWPIPWTAEDSITTWLAPERLLLFAPVGAPNDSVEIRLTIDGRPVPMRKAYTAVRRVPSTFVGFYADVSRLEPDVEHRFEVELVSGRPGQFRGLFFENVEPEYTTVIRRASR